MSDTSGMTTEEISDAAFISVMETNDKLMKGIDVLKRQRDTLLELVKEAMPYMEKYAIYDGGWTARARAVLPRSEGSPFRESRPSRTDTSEEPKEESDAGT